MRTDQNGNFETFEKDTSNIDFYINEVVCFNSILDDLLRREPETRQAILDASYKDLLCLRVQVSQTCKKLEMLFDKKILQADYFETCAAAGEHPLTYGND